MRVWLFFSIVLIATRCPPSQCSTLEIPDECRLPYPAYMFSYVIENIPYVIIDDPMRLYRIQSCLLATSFIKSAEPLKDLALHLDLENPETIHFPYRLYWGPETDEIYALPLRGQESILHHFVGFVPGDELTIQAISANGSGPREDIVIDDILFHSYGQVSFVILKCKPVSLDSSWPSHDGYPQTPYICHRKVPWNPRAQRTPMKSVIPETVSQAADDFFRKLRAWIAKEYGVKVDELPEGSFPSFRMNIMPFKQLLPGGLSRVLYCVVLSWGEKDAVGRLYILDEEGTIEYTPESEVGMYNRIVGITDVDRNGTHEILVHYGGWSGGGIQLFTYRRCKADQEPRFLMLMEATTVFD